MRKTGYFAAGFGAVLTLVLSLVRGGSWYERERLKTMSETLELVDSGFWAGLILVLFGLVLILWSLRRPAERRTETPAPLVQTWICPACGCENGDGVKLCRVCNTPRYRAPEQWLCPLCGAANPNSSERCLACGSSRYRRARAWVCPWCGSAVDESEAFCPTCGGRRPETNS